MNIVIKVLGKIKNSIETVTKKIQRKSDKQFVALEKWYSEDPHSLKRSTFNNLTEQSIVFDLGGYEGQWTSDIIARYNCKIFVFEPVKEYFNIIINRFKNNLKVTSFQFGLSDKTYEAEIGIDQFASSTFDSVKKHRKKETILIKSFNEFLNEQELTQVDLMKVNIEGGEFELLEMLTCNGGIKQVHQMLVQFHIFVPNAEERRSAIRNKLRETHVEVFNYEYVWEYWVIK